MRIRIDKSELYPLYTPHALTSDYGHFTADVPREVIERWNAVMPEFRRLQEILEALYEGPSDLIPIDTVDDDVVPVEDGPLPAGEGEVP